MFSYIDPADSKPLRGIVKQILYPSIEPKKTLNIVRQFFEVLRSSVQNLFIVESSKAEGHSVAEPIIIYFRLRFQPYIVTSNWSITVPVPSNVVSYHCR